MKIVECPRDAMQGLAAFIPTESKVSYINQLLKVGFDTIDFGSFVSPEAIPQMRDTAEVLNGLQVGPSQSKLLAIVANLRGAQDAASVGGIHYLGFPLSLSETFQKRNTNRTIDQAIVTVAEIQNLCANSDMQLVTYLSMGFGNPYNDPYDEGMVTSFVERLVDMGIYIISLADTTGVSNTQNITKLFDSLIPGFPKVEFGAHLHSHSSGVHEKIVAAYRAGCRRFDGALKGYGGCPMAEDQLVGNIPTESLMACLADLGERIDYNKEALQAAMDMVPDIFSNRT
ncbi:MAG: hydroxymethylglutaryl-CoA lyase [Bacteroidetes bacterium]|nr:MAG: hydroxymethylglutaryl-CoA lyase [Bacteroidota bacterium]